MPSLYGFRRLQWENIYLSYRNSGFSHETAKTIAWNAIRDQEGN